MAAKIAWAPCSTVSQFETARRRDETSLKRALEGRHIIVVSSRQLSALSPESLGGIRLGVASDSADSPSFFDHAAGNRASELASGATDDNDLSHNVRVGIFDRVHS